MNIERAKQIMDSKGVIQVLYDGSPVWIEGIRGTNADITNIQTKNRSEVPLSKLIEGNSSING